MGTPIVDRTSLVQSPRVIVTQQQPQQVVPVGMPVMVRMNFSPIRMTEIPENKFVLNP
jgi:hypothetical protein